MTLPKSTDGGFLIVALVAATNDELTTTVLLVGSRLICHFFSLDFRQVELYFSVCQSPRTIGTKLSLSQGPANVK